MREVQIPPKSLDRLVPLIGPDRAARLQQAAVQTRRALEGRTVWNVNATAEGGGVAELLTSLLAYGRGAGVDTRWLVLDGDPDFFALTKRVHNKIHGVAGDGGPLGQEERRHYDEVLQDNLPYLVRQVRPGDVVLLHDPQTAGLVPSVLGLNEVLVVWRSHIGWDVGNEHTDAGWAFLRSDVERADRIVFSRRQFAPEWVPAEKLRVIAPSIDPYALKNLDLEPGRARAVLAQAGLLADGEPDDDLSFVRVDGTTAQVRPHADLLVDGAEPPPADARLVVQISRWDRLKDMAGVLRGFAEALADLPDDAHLVLVGPEVGGVADDPEGAEVLGECTELWRDLPAAAQD
ncbi:MAG: glycosyl transferase family 1, partial [Actinomycetes bacterium]